MSTTSSPTSRRRPIESSGPSWAGRIAVGVALALHIWVVATIAGQPLQVERAPADQRSLIWSLHNDTIHRIGPAADFFAIYHAGHNLKHGQSPYAYDESPAKTPYFFAFRYLPIVGQTLGWVASSFDPLPAWRGWVLFLEAALGLFIFTYWRRVKQAWLKCTATCLALLSSPYLLELHMGQFTFVTTALVLIAMLVHGWPMEGRRPTRWTGVAAAVAYTVAVLLKLFPLAVVPAMVRNRKFWPVAATAMIGVVLVSAPFFLLNPGDWAVFFQDNFSNPQGGMDSGNYGLTYLIYLTSHALDIEWVTRNWIGFAALLRNAVLLGTLLLVVFSRSQQWVVMVCVMLLAHFISYLHVWEHHMSAVVLIGLVLLAAQYRDPTGEDESPPAWLVPVIVAAVVALALPTPFALVDSLKDIRVEDPSQAWSFPVKAMLVLCKALPTLSLYTVGVYLVARAGFRWPLPLPEVRSE